VEEQRAVGCGRHDEVKLRREREAGHGILVAVQHVSRRRPQRQAAAAAPLAPDARPQAACTAHAHYVPDDERRVLAPCNTRPQPLMKRASPVHVSGNSCEHPLMSQWQIRIHASGHLKGGK
jgi:hypothetical protein